MNRWVVLVWFRPTADPQDVQSWYAAAAGLRGASVSPNLAGSVGGGDAVWDLRAPAASLASIPEVAGLLDAACLAAADALELDVIGSGYRALPGPLVKRTLALTVREGTPACEIHRFERSLQAMADHIPEIGSWSLSRVRAERSDGRWTHVWEQEYADVDGLRVAYMRAPYHWTGVDRWFDPEVPCHIVEPRLAHMFRWADRPVLTS